MVLAFEGKDPRRVKIRVNNKTVRQIIFNYFVII